MSARTVSDYLTQPVLSISIDDDLARADQLMRWQRLSCVPVLDQSGDAVGVISRTDLLRLGRVRARMTGARSVLELPAMNVGDAMTPRILTVEPDAPVSEAARLMIEHRVHRLFVMGGSAPVGVISTKELLRAVMDARLGAPLSWVMSSPVLCVDVRDQASTAVDLLGRAGISGVVVLEGTQPVGIYTQTEALETRELPATAPVEELMSQSLLCLPQETPLFRAAGFTMATRARRVLALAGHHVAGVVTGLDFARALLPDPPRTSAEVGQA